MSEAIEKAVALNLSSLGYIGPEIVLTAAILLIVVVDLILSARKRAALTAITLAVLVVCLVVTARLYDEPGYGEENNA